MNPPTIAAPEWTRFFPSKGTSLPDVLHARFVRHAYTRHTHDEYVVGIIEAGVQRLDLERGVHYSPAGSIVMINPGKSHTGGPGLPDGYVYRTFYASESFIRTAAAELGATSAILPSFRKTVITDQRLYDVLLAFHRSLADAAASLEQEFTFATPSRFWCAGTPIRGRRIGGSQARPSNPKGAAISHEATCAMCLCPSWRGLAAAVHFIWLERSRYSSACRRTRTSTIFVWLTPNG